MMVLRSTRSIVDWLGSAANVLGSTFEKCGDFVNHCFLGFPLGQHSKLNMVLRRGIQGALKSRNIVQ